MATKLKDVEQYMLQQFLNRGVLDQYNFKDVFRLVLDKFDIGYNKKEKDDFNYLIVTYLKNINAAIKPYSMEIKMGKCELLGVTFYCLVRQYDSNGIGNLSKLYSHGQLKIFKLILNTIIASNEGLVGLNSIINLVCTDLVELHMTIDAIKSAIDRFIKDYWLILDANSNLGLHGRAIIELGQYLVEVYGQDSVLNCTMCQQIVIYGVQCEQCLSKMHTHCAKKYFKNRKDCVSCKNVFADEDIIAVRGDEVSKTQTQTQILSHTQIKQDINDENDDNDTANDEDEQSQVTRPKRKKK
jgi:hypothetical protein